MATDFKYFLGILYTCEMKDSDNLMNVVAQLAADGTACERERVTKGGMCICIV